LKTVGVICEYNPFHLGHARQFHLIRQLLGNDTRIVCVMSGNYVQRGMPAMWDKSVRAAAALHCGADLVLELPITGVLQSAEGFARAGVDILSRMGCVDILCFGTECGSAEMLMEMAKRMDNPAVIAELKEKMEQGLPYAAARQATIGDDHDLLRGPNNILGLEYCRAIVHLNSNLIPMAVTRNGDYHAFDADQNEPSATAVRNLYPGGNWKDFVPEEAARFVKETGVAALAVMVGTAHGRYKQAPTLDIQRIKDIKEATGIPLVLHGGSGIPEDQVKASIEAGIRKVNFGTDVCFSFLDSVFAAPRDKYAIDLFMKPVVEAVAEFAREKIRLLGAENKA